LPTYEYVCRSCGEHLEVVQSFKDEPLTTCPTCGGQLRKVFGAIGIAFKGSGFYKTDSRTKPAAEAATSGASSSDGAKAGDKGDKGEKKGDAAKSATTKSEAKAAASK
jgi:putative FmdB family regulatory protein